MVQINYKIIAFTRSKSDHKNPFQQNQKAMFEQRIGLNYFEYQILKQGYALHYVDALHSGCQANIYTFDPDSNEIENMFIGLYLQPISLETKTLSSTNDAKAISSFEIKKDQIEIIFDPKYLEKWNWKDVIGPIFLAFFDINTKAIYGNFIHKQPDDSELELNKKIIIKLDKKLNNKAISNLRKIKNKVLDIFAQPYISEYKTKRKQRNDAHILGDKGACFFEWKALSSQCLVDRIHDEIDYGIDANLYTYNKDYESEHNEIPVIVQIKAQDYPEYTDDSLVYRQVQTQHLDHWLSSPYPVVLVVYDANTEKAYWVDIKDYFQDRELSEKTNTVHIPLENELNEAAFNKIRALKEQVVKNLMEKLKQ